MKRDRMKFALAVLACAAFIYAVLVWHMTAPEPLPTTGAPSINGTLDVAKKDDVNLIPELTVDPAIGPKTIAECVLYDDNPTIKMKPGSYVAPNDIFGSWFSGNPSFRKVVHMPRHVLRTLFDDPHERCAAYYLLRISLNGKVIYETRAVAE